MSRSSLSKLNQTVSQLFQGLLGCLFIGWGVLNFLGTIRAKPPENPQEQLPAWYLSVPLIGLAIIVPVAIGVWVLWRALETTNSKR